MELRYRKQSTEKCKKKNKKKNNNNNNLDLQVYEIELWCI